MTEFLASEFNPRGNKRRKAIKDIMLLIVVDNMNEYDKADTDKGA